MSQSLETSRLSEFQRGSIEIFVRAAQVLGVPRSIGEIYGLLYSTEAPLSMDDIMERLQISKGSASQGLRWLRMMGAVHASYVPGDRRDHFVAEIELRKLASGFLNEQIRPHLNSGTSLLDRLETMVDSSFAGTRVKKLRRWQRFATQVLPLLLRVAEKF